MKVRVITAVIGIIAVLLLVWLGGVFFSGAVLAVALLAVHEYNKMLKNINVHLVVPLIAAAQLVLIGAASFGSLKVFLGMIPLCLVLLLCPILKLNQDKMTSLIYTVFGSFYFGIGFGALILLRRNADLITQSSLWMEPGIFLVMFALVDTWASDSFAYLVGRRFGRHKMAPHISPNKTVEGLLGGVAGCIILGTIVAWAFGYNVFYGFIMSLMASVMAPIGDLFESYMKRACDVKDSGQILPGHGGMMDRFDSILFVAPVFVSTLILFAH